MRNILLSLFKGPKLPLVISATGTPEAWGSVFSGIPEDAEVVLSVPQSWVLVKSLRLPTADDQELEAMAALQTGTLLPLPPAELLTGYEVLVTADGHSEVLLTVVRRDKLTPVLEALGKAGGAVHRAVPGALAGFWRFLSENPTSETVLLLDLDEEAAIGIAEGGKLRTVRGIAGPADHRRLAEEISATAAGRVIARGVYFSRGDSPPALSFPWEAAAPNISAAAFGAPRASGMRTDLLPAEYRRSSEWKRQSKDRKLFGILGGVLLAFMLACWGLGARRAAARVGQTEARIAALEPRAKELAAMVEEIKRGRRGAGSAVGALRAVERGLPAGIVLTSLSSEGNGSYTLQGAAADMAKAVEAVESLKKVVYFSQVEMASSQTRQSGERELAEFTIVCRAAGPDAQ